MRRLALAVAAVAASGAVTLAHAADLHSLTVSASAKKIEVDYAVAGPAGQRPSPIRRVQLAMAGVLVDQRGFPRCTFAQADQVELESVLAACGRAQVGSGRIDLVLGLVHDKADATGCSVDLRIFNLGARRLALRADRAAEEDCLLDPQTAIRADVRRTRLGGRRADRLRFEVPDFVRHPLDGLEVAIVRVRATLAGPTRKGRPFFSGVCGGRRVAQVVTLDEAGQGARTRARTRC